MSWLGIFGTQLATLFRTVEGDCLIFFIPLLEEPGLFSVPAPSFHPRGVRRGFFIGLKAGE